MEDIKRIRDLFDAVREIDDELKREHLLDEACGADLELRNRIESLLAADREAGSFLKLDDQVGESNQYASAEDAVDEVVGPYRIRERLGEGGMGEVYVAEQFEPVRRKVALKIIKPGMATRDVVARFEAERQALALMDHPHIARVFDGGVTESGKPYFVMEIAPGTPITEFCDNQRLTTRERLNLLRDVCNAIQHAHQKGIIHRDIKPSNILVAEIDGVARPKVIDFGVAKAVSQELTEQSLYSNVSQMLGTPLYMSPEQATLGVLDVDTRSDVYSLGVLLYELLTGQTPIDRRKLKQSGVDEIRRIIREDEPSVPSDLVSTLQGEALSTVSDRRSCEPRKYFHALRGELDWITMKALEKDRSRRYQSASSMADDIERYLAGDAVEASPPSRWYRVKKLASRHKLALITSLTVTASLLIGIAVASYYARKAWLAQGEAFANLDLATQRANESEALANFILDGIIQAARPENSSTPGPTLHEFLRQASSQIDEAFGAQPRLEAWVRHHIADALLELGDYGLAEENISKALQLWREVDGESNPQALQAADTLAVIYGLQGRSAEAVELAEDILETRKRVRGASHPKTLYSINTLGRAYLASQRYADAELVLLELLKLSSQVDSTEHYLWALNNVSIAQKAQGKLDLAEKHLQIAIEKGKVHRGADHPSTLDAQHNLADLLAQKGNYEEARTAYQGVLATRRQVLGEQHPDTLKTLANFANLDYRIGDYPNARTKLEALLVEYRQGVGNPSSIAGVLNTLSLVYRRQGMLEKSLKAAEESLAIFEQATGDRSASTLTALNSLAGTYSELRRWDQAKHCYEQLIDRRQHIYDQQPDDFSNVTKLGGTLCNLGTLLRKQGKYESAVFAYQQAIPKLELASESSSLAMAKVFLCNAHWGYGNTLRRLQRFPESLKELNTAKSLAQSINVRNSIEIYRMITSAANGQHEAAVAELETLLSQTDWQPEAENWYDAARVYSLGLTALVNAQEQTSDKQLSPDGQSVLRGLAKQTQQYENRAVELLTKARDGGFIDHPTRVALMEAEEDLASLRECDQFTSLLKQQRGHQEEN